MSSEISRHPGTRTSPAASHALLNLHGLTSPETTSGASWIVEATAIESNDEPVKCLLDHDGCDVEERVDAAAAEHDEHEVAEPIPMQVRVRGLLEQHINSY
jgi:hypothetical protein